MAKSPDFAAILKENGLKVTKQRLQILRVLSESGDRHLTAEEIYDLVRVVSPDMGLATVYRTIQVLSELHLVDRIHLDDGCVRYELGCRSEKHRHHHLICLECGKVISFEDDLLEKLENRIQSSLGFTVTDHEVKLFGYCRECQKNQDR